MKFVIAKCVGCGAKRAIQGGEVPQGEMPMCNKCGSLMIAEQAVAKVEAKTKAENECHLCGKEAAMTCECGDYWCGPCFAHCSATGCTKAVYTTDSKKHPYCRDHTDLCEYPYTAKIIKTPDNHDSDDVRFFYKGEGLKGFGYRAKTGGNIALMKCPNCERENYKPNVPSGNCTWCEFSTSEVQIIK